MPKSKRNALPASALTPIYSHMPSTYTWAKRRTSPRPSVYALATSGGETGVKQVGFVGAEVVHHSAHFFDCAVNRIHQPGDKVPPCSGFVVFLDAHFPPAAQGLSGRQVRAEFLLAGITYWARP